MSNNEEIKSLIDTFYDIISGKAGETKDWEEFKKLFYPNAHLLSVRFNEKEICTSKAEDIDSYSQKLSEILYSKDFYEYGLNYRIEVFGNIAQVYSEYIAKNMETDVKIIKKGINLVQLIHNGSEWKILNMLWEDTK